MKYIYYAAGIVVFFAMQLGLSSCNPNSNNATLPGSWDKLGDFEGIPRSGAVGFVINGYAYIGTGFNYELAGQAGQSGRLVDFWKYDPSADSWTQMTDFPGTARSGGVAFELNGKGYVGSGLDANSNALSDFYEFDPSTSLRGSWKPIADIGLTNDPQTTQIIQRYGAVAFTVTDPSLSTERAFVGGGHYLSDLIDLWEYDAANNVWIQRPSIGGSKRQNGFVMVINNLAYVGGGTDNGQYAKDLYKFDITKLNPDGTGSPWSAMNGLTGKDANGNAITQPRPRELASTFTIGSMGYLVCGSSSGVFGALNDTWQYNPVLDQWIQYFSFSTNTPVTGSSRASAVGFALGNFGYVVAGGAGNTKFDDCWIFNPNGVEPDNK